MVVKRVKPHGIICLILFTVTNIIKILCITDTEYDGDSSSS